MHVIGYIPICMSLLQLLSECCSRTVELRFHNFFLAMHKARYLQGWIRDA